MWGTWRTHCVVRDIPNWLPGHKRVYDEFGNERAAPAGHYRAWRLNILDTGLVRPSIAELQFRDANGVDRCVDGTHFTDQAAATGLLANRLFERTRRRSGWSTAPRPGRLRSPM